MQPQQADSQPRADWFPDWMPNLTTSTARTNPTTHYLVPGGDANRLSNTSHDLSSKGSKFETMEEGQDADQIPPALPDDELVIERKHDRAVKYAFMIK